MCTLESANDVRSEDLAKKPTHGPTQKASKDWMQTAGYAFIVHINGECYRVIVTFNINVGIVILIVLNYLGQYFELLHTLLAAHSLII